MVDLRSSSFELGNDRTGFSLACDHLIAQGPVNLCLGLVGDSRFCWDGVEGIRR